MRLIDLTGQRFGRLSVLKRARDLRKGVPSWLCECDCGKETVVTGSNLRGGVTKSCGCLQHPSFVDIAGKRFGSLVVVERIESGKCRGVRWRCLCDCGGETTSTTSMLNSGHKVSCGCVYRYDLTGRRFGMLIVLERAPNRGKRVAWKCRCDCGQTAFCTTANLSRGASQSCGCVRTKHMGKGTLLYRTWAGMKNRCLNPNNSAYKWYGGRGISVCQEWVDDFAEIPLPPYHL